MAPSKDIKKRTRNNKKLLRYRDGYLEYYVYIPTQDPTANGGLNDYEGDKKQKDE